MPEKNEEFQNMTIEQMVAKLAEKRNEILENFSKAYLAETGLLPSEVELCCQELPVNNGIIEHVYFFRRRNE